MITITDIKNYIERYKETYRQVKLETPEITSIDAAIEELKHERISSFRKIKKFINYANKMKNHHITTYKNLYYIGYEHSTDEDEYFQQAIDVVRHTFGDATGKIVAVYNNGGYKFYYWYHNALNDTGDFADYMKEAADKLSIMSEHGATFRTITDIHNDYADDEAEWLYVFRV